jgi:hypothetical protein
MDQTLQFQSESGIQEVAVDTQEVQNAAKQDLNFLAGLAIPEHFKFLFPPVFISVWLWLLEWLPKVRAFPKLALGLPRGFGKTTVIKLFILYCILFTKKKFIIVISASADLAENIIADVVDMLDNDNIKKVFGDWRLGLEKDTQALKKFGFRGRNIILRAAGAGTSIRGIVLKNERPDVMIFEDIQTREQADSQIESEKLEKWMIGTAMKTKSPFGCMYIFVANMYPTRWSILRKLKANPEWTKFIVGGILSDGSSLWEELHPIEQLMQEFDADLASGHPEIFYSEVLNDENAAVNNLLDISKLPPYPYDDNDIFAGNAIIIDPAAGKATSDAVAIGYFEYLEGVPVLKEVREERFSPGETIRVALEMALRKNCRLIAIESNAYQSTLCYWFQFICAQMQIVGIEAVEIYSGSYSKNSRILEMFKGWAKGELYVHPSCYSQVALQAAQFNPLKRDNVDGILDLLTYAPRVLREFEQFIMSTGIIMEQDLGEHRVAHVLENAAF